MNVTNDVTNDVIYVTNDDGWILLLLQYVLSVYETIFTAFPINMHSIGSKFQQHI